MYSNMTESFCKKNHSQVSPLVKALYVHVPFCTSKCRYCDFYSQVGDEKLKHRYVIAATRELEFNRNILNNPASSIFVGGGTPTSLGHALLDELLGELHCWSDANTEFTVEVNPGTVDIQMADVLLKNGVNRVSLGAQTFNPGLLELLGRVHNPQQIHEALEILHNSGVKNISLDLIYGLPGQNLEMWAGDIQEGLGAKVDHFSCYALSFEENTPLREDINAYRIEVVEDELQREMYYHTIREVESRGFEQYEISNFARPGFQCLHNMTYWSNEGYLGIGPAAASYVNGERMVNTPDLQDYLERIERGFAPQHNSERLVGRGEMGETLMLGLRLIEGVKTASFVRRFGIAPVDAFPRSFQRYIREGALIKTDTHIHLSKESLFTADTVLTDILAEV